MTVKELKERLERAFDENAEVVVNTPLGEFTINGATVRWRIL